MIDKNVFIRYPNGKPKAFTMSFDDGRLRDADIISVLQKNGMKATFFLADGMFGKSQFIVADNAAAKRQYADTGMEVAAHSTNHRDLPTVLEQEGQQGLKREITDNVAALERVFGCRVFGFSYPGAPPYKLYNEEVIAFAEQNGIAYARGVAKNKNSFALPQRWLEWGPTVWIGSVDEIDSLTKQFLSAAVNDEPLLYNIWGHAYDIDDKWDSFEAFVSFCEKVGNCPDVWYATYGEIYSYVKAFERLEFADNNITNRSDITLWFSYDGKIHKISSGQKINI